MTNNYDFVVTCNSSGATHSQKKESTSYTNTNRTWLSWVTALVMLLSFGFMQGQSSANYAFTTGASTLNSMTGSTPVPGITVFPADFATSTVVPIGFNFLYMGNYYSHFNVNCDGQLRLHTNGSATAMPSSVSSYALNTVTIAPMGGDNETGNGISFLVTGSAPNRKLIVEWNNFYANWTDPQTSGNMQLVLNETTGVIEFLYGNILNSSTSSTSKSIFHSSSNTANASAFITVGATPTVNTTATSPTANSFAASVAIANLANLFYTFTPPAPASGPTDLTLSAVTQTSMTLNWTAAATTTGIVRYAVLNSTNGGATYNFVANVPLGTTTFNATALASGTTYDWRVVAISEGVESTPASATQATPAATTYYWVGTSSSGTPEAFTTLTNWNTAADGSGTAPAAITATSTDIFIVDGDGSTTTGGNVYISLAANTTVGQFKVISNTALTVQAASGTAARIITVTGAQGDDFVIETGSTLNLTTATPAGFAFSGSDNTGLIAGTLNFAGSGTGFTANVFNTTGGTRTLVTVPATGVVNLGTSTATGGGTNTLVGSAATLSFLAGSNCNSTAATTGAPPVPLATWDTTSTLTITGLTNSTTAATNNNQSFGNIVFNCPLLTSSFNFFGSNTQTLKGNLTIVAAGATGGTGIFRVNSGGILTINGNILISQGRFQATTTATVIANGNTTVEANGILDTASSTGTFSQRGATLTNNGVLTGTTGTLTFVNLTGSFPQTLAGSGTVLTNLATLTVQNTAGLTITHTNAITIARANLIQGTVTNSDVIQFGTGLAIPCTTQIGAAGLTTPGGNFDAEPIFNLGTGTYSLIYAQESTSRTTGFEVPPTRAVNALSLTNANGLVVAGGGLSTGTLTFGTGSGNITTTNANLLTVTGTATGSIVRTSATAYVNGPLAITLPASLATGFTYTFPIGKATLNPFQVIDATTGAGGTVTIRSEVFDAATGGTAGNLLAAINTNRYWATSITAGAANFVDARVRLNDTPGTADGIGASLTQAGAYDLIGGLTATVAPTSITINTPASLTDYGFYVMGTRATPVVSNLTITPQGNRCPAVARTVTVNVAVGAGAITGVVINYSINGTAQTAIPMTLTSGTTWSGTIPVPTPSNATIAWSITATDANSLTATQAGVTYSDEGLGTDVITITPSVPNFCGTGGAVTLTASSSIAGVTYTWESLTSGVTLSATSGTSTSATITTSTDFKVTGTPTDGSCPSVGYISVGVYELPTALVTTTANGVCPGTSATIGSGLNAGNFTVTSIPYAGTNAPANASVIMNNGTAVLPLTGGTMDDGGWSNIPLGFNFNYFGTNFNTISAGTNGLLMFGTPSGYGTLTGQLGQFSFTGPPFFPNTANPGNIIALMATDMHMGNNTTDGSIKYWTEGYAPNRTFVIEYKNVYGYSANPKATVQCRLKETIGTVEIHIFEKTFTNNAIVGLQDVTKTIGAVAPGRAGGTWTVTTPEAWRFNPPANYTTTWTATDANGSNVIATGTNIFSQTVSPAITTTYSISYTNQTTGCTNAPGSAQTVMNVLSSTAPAGVNTVASASTLCLGQSVNLSMNYTGSTDGLVFQWQSSIDNGTSWQNIASATATTTTVTPTVPTRYRCEIISCGGTPGYSSVAPITFANEISATTAATRCGIGTASIEATPNTGATVNWYAAASGGSPIGTGSPFTTPSIAATTTYFAAATTFSSGSIVSGLGATNSSSSGESFLPGFWGGAKTQYIIRASELAALGLSAGDITSLGFETTDSGQTYQGFNIHLGHTTETTAPAATFIPNTALTKVFSGTLANDGFTPAIGTNNLVFGTGTAAESEFTWDGTSNIVVSFSWTSVPAAFTSTPTTMKVDNVGFVATAVRQSDNLSPADMLAVTSVSSTSSFRPRFIINGQIVCQSPRIPVVVTVNPAPALTLSSASTTICSGVATTVPVTVTSTVADFDTYTWSPSTGVTGDSTTGWTFNPTSTTTYTLTASQTAGALCSNTVTYVVNTNPLPSAMTITPATPAVCVDSVQALTITGGTLSSNGKIGSGTSANTNSTPFKGFWGGSKTQALYTASELTSLGMTAGQSLTSIGYVALSGTPLVLNDFSINAGFVSDLDLGTSFISGASNVVLAPVNYTPSTGIGTIDFALSTPLVWDGVSNLLVETCFNNNNFGGSSDNSISVESSTVATGLNLYRTQDNTADVCTNSAFISSSTSRPNLRVTIVETANITWLPVTNLFTDAAATTPYTVGANASTVYVKSASAATTDYTAKATTTVTGCSTTATVSVVVNALPTVVTVAPTAVCSPSTVDLTAAAVTTGSDAGLNFTYFTDMAATTAVATPSAIATSGTYYIKGTNANGCISIASVVVTVNPLPTVVTVTPATVCSPNTVDLTAAAVTTGSDAGLTFEYFTDMAATTALATPSAVATSGTYYIKGTNANGCVSIASVVVTVTVTDAPTGSATQSFCGTANLSNLVVVGDGIKWYNAATNGTEYPAALLSSIGLVNGTTYFASQTQNGCESTERFAVTVTVSSIPTAPNAAAQTFCSGATVADLAPNGSGLNWYDSATATTALAATTVLTSTTYFVSQTVNGCESSKTSVVITISTVTAPTGSATQTFSVAALADATIEDLVVTGTGVVWYATEDDAINGTNALAAGTQLVSGSTYYAVSNAGGCSSTPFAVTVTITLGNNSFDSTNLKVYPNPVVDVFTVKYDKEIESIKVFDLSGRLVRQISPKQLEAQVDMTELAAAMYIVKVNAGGKQAEIKVMKK